MSIVEERTTWEQPTSTPSARPTTILVIDDRQENRALIRRLFEPLGYWVIEAENGPQGLTEAESKRPDCIILDLEMPRMSGFEVLDQLQGDPRTRETPVIILTASDDSLRKMERALRAGAVDYLTKPISPLRVAVRVRGAIERRRLLQELQDLRTSFTSMLVHDLRAPLTVIQGYAELLGRDFAGPLNDRQHKYVDEVHRASDRMLRLIGEILDLSKLEAGRLTLERRAVDLAALVTEIVERVQPVAADKRITLRRTGPASLAPLEADPFRLEQVLMNLLSNALKFTPEEGTVTVEVSERGGGQEVAVADTGPGIPAAELPLLFEPFSQVSTAQKAAGQGTGLGLVICRHLVEAHGGRIWAKNELPRGARFAFRLPVMTAPAPPV